jgi:hypothetical protein
MQGDGGREHTAVEALRGLAVLALGLAAVFLGAPTFLVVVALVVVFSGFLVAVAFLVAVLVVVF